MTMVPAQNLFKQQHYDGYGGGGYIYTGTLGHMSVIGGYDYCSEACLGFDLVDGHMAEENSRTNSLNEAGSSSKGIQEERDEGWLQLGIGGYETGRELKFDQAELMTTPRPGLIELDLLPGGRSNSSRSTAQHIKPLTPIFPVTQFRAPRPITNTASSSINTPMFLQHPITSLSFPQPEVTWGYRPNLWNTTASSSSSPVPSLPGPYYARQFQHHGIDSNSDIRIVDAPPRPHSGVWFVLQASQNQAKEPFLPQIPKSYLRIKDGRMTVRLLMKYLVNKLRLDSESEVEIQCRGQQLVPILTLQQVRDNIWISSREEEVTLLPDSSTTDHVMILHYGRIA